MADAHFYSPPTRCQLYSGAQGILGQFSDYVDKSGVSWMAPEGSVVDNRSTGRDLRSPEWRSQGEKGLRSLPAMSFFSKFYPVVLGPVIRCFNY